MKRLIWAALLSLCTGAVAAPAYVQKSSVANFPNGGSGSTAVMTLTGVTSGNTIIVQCWASDYSGTSHTITAADGDGSYTSDRQDSQDLGGAYKQAAILHRASASSGTHTITATNGAGSFASYGSCIASEWSGITPTPSSTNSNKSAGSTAPTTGSVTPSTSSSLLISVVALHDAGGSVSFGNPPSGYTSLAVNTDGSVNVTPGSADYKISSSTSAENPSYATYTNSNAWVAAIAVYEASSGGPAIGGLSVTARTTTSLTIGYTSSGGSGTTSLVACKVSLSAPSAAQVVAGNCQDGNAALSAASETSNGADSLSLTGISSHAIVNVYGVHTVSSVNSSLATLADQLLSAQTWFTFTRLASISSTSWCNSLNASISPDIAANDVVSMPSITVPGGFAWTQVSDCDGSYPGDSTRQALRLVTVYDYSAGAWMSGYVDIVFNNQSPAYTPPYLTYAFKTGVAITSVNLCSVASDADGDTLTGSVTSGTLPTGLSVGGTGDCVLSGTPTAENESGTEVTYTVSDGYGGTAELTLTIYPLDTITVPSCVGTAAATCAANLQAIFLNATSSYRCSPSVAVGNVISQSPSSSTEAEPFSSVALLTANGPCSRLFSPNQ